MFESSAPPRPRRRRGAGAVLPCRDCGAVTFRYRAGQRTGADGSIFPSGCRIRNRGTASESHPSIPAFRTRSAYRFARVARSAKLTTRKPVDCIASRRNRVLCAWDRSRPICIQRDSGAAASTFDSSRIARCPSSLLHQHIEGPLSPRQPSADALLCSPCLFQKTRIEFAGRWLSADPLKTNRESPCTASTACPE